jgi:hypothetical protein
MRNLFAILTLVVALVGCDKSHDENGGLNVSIDGAVTTTINVSVDEASSRAVVGENSAVGVFENGILNSDDVTMRYIMQIFIDGEQATKYIEYSDYNSVAFNPELVPNHDYKFVVWADVVTKSNGATEFSNVDNHYNTGDLTNITLKGDWNAMDESRDAFTGFAEEDNFACDHNVNIKLTRPFAKLRIVATDKTKYTVVPATGKVTYTTPHRVTYNAATGEAAAASLANKIHIYNIDTYSDDTDDSYTLFSDYFFAVDEKIKLTFAVYEDNMQTAVINKEYTFDNIEVKCNRLTTIRGEILTGGAVVIDGVAKIGKKLYPTLQAAFDEVKSGETIILLKNITEPDGRKDGNYAYTLNHGFPFTLDLDGKKISTDNQNEILFNIVSGTSVTINNGSFELISQNLPRREFYELPSGLKIYTGDPKGWGADKSTGARGLIYCNGGNISMNNVTVDGGEFGGIETIRVDNGRGVFNNVDIDVKYGCGVVTGSGGDAVLSNCDIQVTGAYYPPYLSVAFGTEGGTITVNSGNYSLINDGEYLDGGTHGGWLAMIRNAGGYMTVNGGRFTSDWHLEYGNNSFIPQNERALFSIDAVSGKTATLEFKSGVVLEPMFSKFLETGGSGSQEVYVKINGEQSSGYSATTNEFVLYRVIYNGDGVWTIR